MKKFIKNNWFKLTIIVCFIIGLFLIYQNNFRKVENLDNNRLALNTENDKQKNLDINLHKLVRLFPFSISNDEILKNAIANGTWVAANQSNSNIFSKDQMNTTNIFCQKLTNKCSESRALLIREHDSDPYDFFVYNFEYEVIEWNENHLKAKSIDFGKIGEITMNFINKTVLLTMVDNPDNPTASTYIDSATLENGFEMWQRE